MKLNRAILAVGFSILILGLLMSACGSAAKKNVTTESTAESGVAKFVFSEEIHNFGSLNAGEIVAYTFSFRNEGTKTLVIAEVDSGCGCMEVIIPEKTIAPGMEGRIEVIFNSSGETGKQLKTITIFSNAEQDRKQIFIKANVTNELIKLYSHDFKKLINETNTNL